MNIKRNHEIGSGFLVRLAESLLDDAVSEYRELNLENSQAVQDYALNAMQLAVSEEDAERVREACLKLIEGTELEGSQFGSSEYYYRTITDPLSK